MKALGLAVRDCSSMHDVVQLQDFAKLAIKNGQPLQVFSILKDVAGFILKYPGEARQVMKFIRTQEKDTFEQKSVWMRPALVDMNQAPKGPPQKADVVIIGGGISAAYMSRHLPRRSATARPAGKISSCSRRTRRRSASTWRHCGTPASSAPRSTTSSTSTRS